MTVLTGTMAVPENAWAGQGAVLLDIGGEVGALVIQMPGEMVGLEVEIRPLDPRKAARNDGARDQAHHDAHHHAHHHAGHDHEHRPEHEHEHLAHVAVVARPVGEARVPSLVFPELAAGRYELFEKGHREAVGLRVEVTGGAVTEASWRSVPSAEAPS